MDHGLPTDDRELKEAHASSSKNKNRVAASKAANGAYGCFYCLHRGSAHDVVQFEGSTALCPRCTIDTVLVRPEWITDDFLKKMRKRWFDV